MTFWLCWIIFVLLRRFFKKIILKIGGGKMAQKITEYKCKKCGYVTNAINKSIVDKCCWCGGVVIKIHYGAILVDVAMEGGIVCQG